MRSRLAISTPDGSGQAVHPDVVDTRTGFAGHRYWMVFTPYPFFDDRLENPTLRVSDDGVNWTPLAGAPDPLFPAPATAGEHWSDTDLVIADGRLHLYFRHCIQGGVDPSVWVSTSRDGITWTDPRLVLRGEGLLSPAIVAEPSGWLMWYVAFDGPGGLLFRRAGAHYDAFGEAVRCQMEIPGFVLWHVDIIRTAEGYEALACAYREGLDASHSQLFHLSSRDGITFALTHRDPIIKPQHGTWASRMVYRSTFQKYEDGRYRIWYSGASWPKATGIGLAEGPLDGLDYSVGERVEVAPVELGRELLLHARWKFGRHPAAKWLYSRTH